MKDEAPSAEVSDVRAPTRTISPWMRLGLVASLVAALWLGVTATGLGEMLQEEQLRALVMRAGVWGAVVFLAAFTLGQMMHLPGVIFFAAATFAWGAPIGAVMSVLGATVAVSVNFYVVRRVGGGALVDMRRPLLIKVISSLHRRPRATMVLARVVFLTSPLLTTMFALSGVRFRDHIGASAIGMALPTVAWVLVLDKVIL